ncbi:MAG: heparinase II/III family protein, partial [Paludibacter sp.]|nr:heparinase II/III family protein [Paludibacter sp.]
MKFRILTVLAISFLLMPVMAQELNTEVFKLLTFDNPGLEQVKAAVSVNDYKKAAEALLKYYRTRSNVQHPEVNL